MGVSKFKNKYCLKFPAAALIIAALAAFALQTGFWGDSISMPLAEKARPLAWPETNATATGICEGCNIIIIDLDTLRADHVGAYGYFRNTTPNIDRLASRGTLFENAFAQSGWSSSSHSSIFTSRYPHAHGVVRPDRTLLESELTLAEILKIYGYSTAAFAGGSYLAGDIGFTQGFDVYDDGLTEFKKLAKRQPNESIGANMPLFPIKRSLNAAEDWLEKNKGRKFFVFIHGYDPHCFYKFEPDERLVFTDTTYQLTINNDEECDKTRFVNATVEDTRFLMDAYDDKIRIADEGIGRFLRWLDEEGLSNNTAIVFLSDHGESFKENKQRPILGHRGFFKAIMHVPLIIYSPKLPAKRIKHFVELVDVSPTILEMLGIPLNHEAQGTSRLPLAAIKGKDDETGFAHAVEFYRPDENTTLIEAALATKEWKYRLLYSYDNPGKLAIPKELFSQGAVFNFSEQLFDFEKDAGENWDLSAQNAETVALYRKLLLAWWEKTAKNNGGVDNQSGTWLGTKSYFGDDDKKP